MSSGVYKITCIVNGKFYIGSSINFKIRWRDHLSELRRGIHDNPHLQNAFNKYGEEAFLFEIIEVVMPWFVLDREQYWLKRLKPFNHDIGFNMNRIADKPPSQKGKPKSMEHRAKISAGNKGKLVSLETRQKQSIVRRGVKKSKPISDEHRANLSKASRGKPKSPEHVEKMANSKRKDFVVITPEGESIPVKGLLRFCLGHGLDNSAMLRVAQGKQTNHKQWKCQYA